MNKWFKLALNSLIGIVILNLSLSILFGGSLQPLAALIVLAIKILNITLVVGLIAGIFETLKRYLTF